MSLPLQPLRVAALLLLGSSMLAVPDLGASQPLGAEQDAMPAPVTGDASFARARWGFRRASAPGRAGEVGLSAVAARAGVIAIGDEDGVQTSVDGAPYQRVVRSKLVSDLHFGADGGLWVAAADGLQYLAPDGTTQQRSPGSGELARAALRVDTADGVIAVGTAAGLFLSADGRRWLPRVGSLPASAITALASRTRLVESIDSEEAYEQVELWAVSGGFPWQLLVERRDDVAVVQSVQRVSVAGRPSGSAPVDLALGLPGAEVVVVYPRALALGDGPDGPWRILRPVLPAGAMLRRIAWFGDRVWLATDRGVLQAPALEAAFQRSAAPAGSAATLAFAAAGERLLVASRVGLLEGQVERVPKSSLRAGDELVRVHSARREPEIDALHRAALQYLGLGPERVHRLRKGVDRRGWLPELDLRFAFARDRDEREDWDQAYLSGDTRSLYDYQRDRHRDFVATVELSWDLGDTLYNSDAIDLSREARQRISLRDDALDEINQLYFERRRVLISLDALPSDADPLEAEQLRLRAQELAAGLDSWTGGWFSAALARDAP